MFPLNSTPPLIFNKISYFGAFSHQYYFYTSLNPNRIFPGSKISIPQEMLKTQEPMPEEFVAGFLPKPKKETLPEGPTPQEEETQELELFGPKELPQQ